MKRLLLSLALGSTAVLAQAGIVKTNDAAIIAAFQNGKVVETFENVAGRSPLVLSDHVNGVAVPEAAQVYNQIDGVRFSVGGTVGVNRPALYQIDPDSGIESEMNAAVVDTVLGGVDFDGNSLFGSSSLLEMYLPAKVDAFGFWVDPSLSGVRVIVLNTNFAFSGEDEDILETIDVPAGMFLAYDRANADIGGIKVISLGNRGFTIDDLTINFEEPGTVPEPATSLLLLPALLAGNWLRRRRTA